MKISEIINEKVMHHSTLVSTPANNIFSNFVSKWKQDKPMVVDAIAQIQKEIHDKRNNV